MIAYVNGSKHHYLTAALAWRAEPLMSRLVAVGRSGKSADG